VGRTRKLIGSLIAVVAASGCASRAYYPYSGPEIDPGAAASREPSPEGDVFSYAAAVPEVSNHVLSDDGLYRRRVLTYRSVGRNGQPDDLVTVRYHQSLVPGRWPALIVMPIWGISTYPSRKITREVMRSSAGRMHVLDVQGDAFLLDWDGLHGAPDAETFLEVWRENIKRERTTVIDIRRLIDWAETRPEIASDRLALIGFSHSAIVAAIIAIHEPRIAATVLVFGGAHPQTTIAHCDGSRTVGLQDKVAQQFGWSRDEYERQLTPILGLMDPARYPGRVDPERVLLFEAGQDPCVAQRSYAALREAMGHPARYTVEASHRKSFYTMTPLYLGWLQGKVWDFLEAVLTEPTRS
jgi:dienelactone hydrolase